MSQGPNINDLTDREKQLLREVTRADVCSRYSNMDPTQLVAMTKQWAKVLGEYRVAEIELGLDRWLKFGKGDFPAPSDIVRMIQENRDDKVFPPPIPGQKAVEHEDPMKKWDELQQNALAKEMRRLHREEGITGFIAMTKALRNLGRPVSTDGPYTQELF